MTSDGKYFCSDYADNIDLANDKDAASKNFFGGLSDKGPYFSCENLLSYISVMVINLQ